MGVGRFFRWMEASGASPGTLKLRRHYLGRAMEAVGCLKTASPDQLTAWLAAQDWSPETRKSARASLASYLTWAGRPDVAAALPRVRVPRALPRPAPDPVYRHALENADPAVALMVALAGGCGLRRAEIAALRWEDEEDGWFRIRGKGGHVRRVPRPEWLHWPGGVTGWVFPSDTSATGHICVETVGKKVAAALGGGWTCHTLRHRYATAAYAGSQDLRAVQELLGHASPATTARYVATGVEALQRAAESAA